MGNRIVWTERYTIYLYDGINSDRKSNRKLYHVNAPLVTYQLFLSVSLISMIFAIYKYPHDMYKIKMLVFKYVWLGLPKYGKYYRGNRIYFNVEMNLSQQLILPYGRARFAGWGYFSSSTNITSESCIKKYLGECFIIWGCQQRT